MQWIGATRWFIMGPFLVEGMLVAVLGTSLAVGVRAGAFHALPREVVLFLSGLAMFHPFFWWTSALFGGGPFMRLIHPFLGAAFGVLFYVYALRLVRDNLLVPSDRRWLAGMFRYMNKKGDDVPVEGKRRGAPACDTPVRRTVPPRAMETLPSLPVPKPSEIVRRLDEYVIGQDDAKRILAVAVYSHYRKLGARSLDGVRVAKSNLLLIGPTGTGKTLTCETLWRLLDVPFVTAGATSLAQTRYVNEEIEAILSRLADRAGGDLGRAGRGIVFIDEIDKLKVPRGETRATSGENVQHALLKIMEGAKVKLHDGITYVGNMNKNLLTRREQIASQLEREGVGGDAGTFLNQFPEPNQADMDAQVAQAVVASTTYARWYGEKYPFKTLKLISSPLMGMSAQAPTSVVFIGEYIFWPTTAVTQLFRTMDPTWITAVTAHEVAHQWFGGMVTNVNFHHYWFVETFAELSAMYYRESVEDKTGLKGTLQYWRNSTLNFDWTKSLGDDVLPREPNVGTLLRYTKGPYIFWMLREYYDETKVLRLMRNLIQAHTGDLISTSDVQRVAEQTFGEDMSWFFDQYVRNVGVPEVRYSFDAPRPAEDGKGWIVTGRLEQSLTIRGEKQAGRYFKKLLVPLTIDTESGAHKEKVFMDGPQQQVRFRVNAKPRGSVKVNDGDVCFMVTKAM